MLHFRLKSSAFAIPALVGTTPKVSARFTNLIDSSIPSSIDEIKEEIAQIEISEQISEADQARLDYLVDIRIIYTNTRKQNLDLSVLRTIEPDEIYALCSLVDPTMPKPEKELALLVMNCRQEMTSVLRLIIQDE
jgi:hypothetical protein